MMVRAGPFILPRSPASYFSACFTARISSGVSDHHPFSRQAKYSAQAYIFSMCYSDVQKFCANWRSLSELRLPSGPTKEYWIFPD